MTKPIKRTLKTNLPGIPQLFAFKFDSDDADGYASTPGYVGVARGEGDGYYNCTLPRSFAETDLIYSAVTVNDGKYLSGVSGKVTDLTDNVLEVITLDSDGAVAQVASAEVQVLLLLKGQV